MAGQPAGLVAVRWWLVYRGTMVTLERARLATEARAQADVRFHRARGRRGWLGGKPVVRRATRADVARYWAAHAQAKGGPATARVA